MATNREERMRIWRGVTNAEKHARYYAVKADKMAWRSKALSTGILAASSGSVLALVAKFPDIVAILLFSLVGVGTIIDMVYAFSREATASLFMKNQCRQLVYEWEDVVMNRDKDSIMEQVVRLEHRLELITSEDPYYNQEESNEHERKAERITKSRLIYERGTNS